MKANKGTIIYIMGAGRSGTTVLATFLGNNKEIQNIGEMHQFFENLDEKKECSCGNLLTECEFWRDKLSQELLNSSFENKELSARMESHSAIFKHIFRLFSNKQIEEYNAVHSKIVEQITLNNDKLLCSRAQSIISSRLIKSDIFISRIIGILKGNNCVKKYKFLRTLVASTIYIMASGLSIGLFIHFIAVSLTIFSSKDCGIKLYAPG